MENCKEIKLGEKGYPTKLSKIKHAPKILYYKGNLEILENGPVLAVVGTRHPTSYGRQALNYLLPQVVKNGVTIVSGLARGIDILSHKITLELEGKAVAVLAGGLDKIYPGEHKNFAQKMVQEGGAIVSEHKLGTQYLKQHFPSRNRIISGVSDAVLLVEAKEKSGALITARFAFEQERKVLSVPGSIFSAESEGTNRILGEKAIPILHGSDLLEQLFCRFQRRKTKILKVEKQKKAFPLLEKNLSAKEREIMELISFGSEITIGEIIKKSGKTAQEVMSMVSRLEIEELVEDVGGGKYVRKQILF